MRDDTDIHPADRHRCEPRPAGCEHGGPVEAHAVRSGVPALHGPGEAEVWSPGVEHPL